MQHGDPRLLHDVLRGGDVADEHTRKPKKWSVMRVDQAGEGRLVAGQEPIDQRALRALDIRGRSPTSEHRRILPGARSRGL